MNFVYIALALFAVAAVIGLYLASHVFQGKFPPLVVAFIHGGFAFLGLAALVYALYRAELLRQGIIGLVLLGTAALFGWGMTYSHIRKRLSPRLMVVMHAGLGVAGLVLVVTSLLTTQRRSVSPQIGLPGGEVEPAVPARNE